MRITRRRARRLGLLIVGGGLVLLSLAWLFPRQTQATGPSAWLLYASHDGSGAGTLYRLATDSTALDAVTADDAVIVADAVTVAEAFDHIVAPTWSPDGDRVTFIAADPALDRDPYLYVAGFDGDAPQRISPFAIDYFGRPYWTQDGAWIVFAQGSQGAYYRIRPDGTDLYQLERPPIDGDPSLADYFEGRWLPANGGEPASITREEGLAMVGSFAEFDLSPDGNWVVNDMHTSEGHGLFLQPVQSLWERGASQYPPDMLAPVAGSVSSLAWSPDGGQIVFATGWYEDRIDIYRLNLADRSVDHLVTDDTYDVVMLAWSPDGDWIGLSAESGLEGAVFRLPADSTQLHTLDDLERLTPDDGLRHGGAAWSPAPEITRTEVRSAPLMAGGGLLAAGVLVQAGTVRRKRKPKRKHARAPIAPVVVDASLADDVDPLPLRPDRTPSIRGGA